MKYSCARESTYPRDTLASLKECNCTEVRKECRSKNSRIKDIEKIKSEVARIRIDEEVEGSR